MKEFILDLKLRNEILFYFGLICFILAFLFLILTQSTTTRIAGVNAWYKPFKFSVSIALYAGWLTVALIPFTSDLLNKSGWKYAPFPPRTWAVIVYAAASLIIFFAYKKVKNPFYIIPLAWAYLGYFVRFDRELKIVAGILMILSLGYFISQIPVFFKRYRNVFLCL